jgi:hypothetical protein
VSTTALLDGPTGPRFQRTRRRNIVRSLERVAANLTGWQKLSAMTTLATLLDIINNRSLTSAEKDSEFERVINLLEKKS